MKPQSLAFHLHAFFVQRLVQEMQASPHTVASYRDTFRLLLTYASHQLETAPTDLQIADIDAEMVGRFLMFVETTRGNSARSRNTRLSSIRSFFKYIALREPQLLHQCQRILAMPSKRYEKKTIDYLQGPEIAALLAAPDPTTWFGRRDRTLLLLALQTGLRVSELIQLNCNDIVLGTGAHVRCQGKGRKERATPLRKDTARALQEWLLERSGKPHQPLFVSLRGGRLSRDAVERLVRKYAALASSQCPSLKSKRISPHVLRHSAAMELLHNGVDCTVIALWLGHERVETTQMYIHANLQMKERAMERTKPVDVQGGRYRPPDKLMAFLEAL